MFYIDQVSSLASLFLPLRPNKTAGGFSSAVIGRSAQLISQS
ncbi:hypothetical protein GCWU000342_00140 [Shuttleworthella satelles DSM 14600]|uniref:Uncharacterized protein n=1 Tax=Shuttleworthella satelles DSM 14600 TaxID=626523 RepID=C4G845_9FIRM|nr:hypothetical protein GCWU000342_00140 [Shuttleworthia satelles DSM 14600]